MQNVKNDLSIKQKICILNQIIIIRLLIIANFFG